MKKILLASAALAMLASAASADMKVGIILGFTGPIESLTPGMAAGAELAMKEASDSGQFLGGQKVIPVRGDSTCVDAAAATAVAERLITSDGVAAIMGADGIVRDGVAAIMGADGIVTLTAWLRHGRCFSVSGCARYPTVVTAFHRSSSSMPSGSIAVSR